MTSSPRSNSLPLNEETRQTIYAGVNYFFAPAPSLGSGEFVDLQGAFNHENLEFEQVQRGDSKLQFARSGEEPLQVEVGLAGPVGQLLIRSPQLKSSVGLFSREARSVCDAVFNVWSGQKQIVRRDGTIRQLYDASGDHAFGFLWQEKLQQPIEKLDPLQRDVLGGGLRLVIPPAGGDSEQTQIEVKIESYFEDLRKLWVQVTVAWPEAVPKVDSFDPQTVVETVQNYAETQVLSFLTDTD